MSITRVGSLGLTGTKFKSTAAAGGTTRFAGGNLSGADFHAAIQNNVGPSKTNIFQQVGPVTGGQLTLNNSTIAQFDLTTKEGNQTISSFSSNDWYTTTKDRGAIIYINGGLTINSGQTFTPSTRKLFTAMYVNGNMTVNGSLSMSSRGANHTGTGDSGSATSDPTAIPLITGTYGGVTNPAATRCGNGGSGGAGTFFSGGPGQTSNHSGGAGGAGGQSEGLQQAHPWVVGGSGQGGGAGNPGGWNAGTGTGGALYVFVKGAYSGSGTVTASGANGGYGVAPNQACDQHFRSSSHGGGGSGGGHVTIISTSGTTPTPTASGGSGGGNGGGCHTSGGAGGAAGTARVLTGL